MIKFFRSIRKSLLAENKTGKYFKYALGEIILVVIGILIALSINNWNSKRIEDSNSLRLAVRLLAETERNIVNLEIDKSRAIGAANGSLSFLQLMTPNYTELNERTIDSLVFEMFISPMYDFNSAVLDQALTSGEVANFGSDSLKNMIFDLPSQIERIRQNELSCKDNLVFFAQFLVDNYSIRKMDYRFSTRGEALGVSKLPEVDNRKILSSQRFENLVDENYYALSGLVSIYEGINEELLLIAKLLKEQIDKR